MHTKGPWKLENDGYVNVLTGPNGEHIAEIELCFENEELDPGSTNQFSTETGTANAKLMCASPDLLKALKAMRTMMWKEGYADQTTAMRKADAAIMKAEGK